jgi:hypothetical protein
VELELGDATRWEVDSCSTSNNSPPIAGRPAPSTARRLCSRSSPEPSLLRPRCLNPLVSRSARGSRCSTDPELTILNLVWGPHVPGAPQPRDGR